MSKKNKKVNEFRKSNKIHGHPAYIYKREGDTYKFIGITHSPITKGVRNIPLDINPNPNDSRKSYARPRSDSDNKKNFSKKLSGWKLDIKDRNKINKIKK